MPPRTRGGYPVFLGSRLLLGGAALGGAVQSAQLLTRRPPRLFGLACSKLADGARGDACARGDVSLADA